jgi:2-dehydro-3-deoxyphosphogluconate aldolase / (4S)-4-hydroxy-2-oxoglutarate aldolase
MEVAKVASAHYCHSGDLGDLVAIFGDLGGLAARVRIRVYTAALIVAFRSAKGYSQPRPFAERKATIREDSVRGSSMSEEVFDRIRSAGVVAVVTIDRAADAVPLADALLAGGITAIELTLRTPVALESLAAIRRQVPDMLVGAGTILMPDQVRQALDAGALYGVAPGMNPRVVEAAALVGLPFGPGVCTPSDIERALEYGRTFLKFFPAEPSGGLAYLRVIAAPYAHLGVSFLPLGGVTESNLAAYLNEPLIGAVGGSWLAPPASIRAGDWSAIRATAARAAAIRAGRG